MDSAQIFFDRRTRLNRIEGRGKHAQHGSSARVCQQSGSVKLIRLKHISSINSSMI